jgi:hypothetical protein
MDKAQKYNNIKIFSVMIFCGIIDLLFTWPNLSSHTMAPGSTRPLTEMNTTNLPGVKGWPACGADNLTAICEPIV